MRSEKEMPFPQMDDVASKAQAPGSGARKDTYFR